MADCTNNPTLESLNLEENQMALRVRFPLVNNSMLPLGNPETSPYNTETVLLNQISSWIPGRLTGSNVFKKECNILVTDKFNGYYLINNYPDIFSQYTG